MIVEKRYVLAVDVGQAKDYTALVIVDSTRITKEKSPSSDPNRTKRVHDVVHIERFRDVPYPQQIERIRERYLELKQVASTKRDADVKVLVDATGVGKPILDALREARVPVQGVLITAGDSTSHSGGVTRVPKRELVASLQIALQSGRLRIAKELPLAETLLKEFRGFRVKISLSGHARFGNDVGDWREADHDDLVLATSLATWKLEMNRGPNLEVMRALAGIRR